MPTSGASTTQAHGRDVGASAAWLAVAWLAVGVPILWGAWITLQKALVLF